MGALLDARYGDPEAEQVWFTAYTEARAAGYGLGWASYLATQRKEAFVARKAEG